jgi:hypothetical protein
MRYIYAEQNIFYMYESSNRFGHICGVDTNIEVSELLLVVVAVVT